MDQSQTPDNADQVIARLRRQAEQAADRALELAYIAAWEVLPGAASLGGLEVVDQLGPVDASPNLDQAALLIEGDNAVHAAHVHEHTVAEELLAAHGVAAAGDA